MFFLSCLHVKKVIMGENRMLRYLNPTTKTKVLANKTQGQVGEIISVERGELS